MKKTITISICVAVLAMIATTANAKSWRINSDETKNADFASINAAMSSSEVIAGDTLYLDPGCTLTGTQTVTKQVTIVGLGYFRDDSPHNFAIIKGALYLRNPLIKVEGVILEGKTYFEAQYVTLERCKTSDIGFGGSQYTAKYATIRQCYVTGQIMGAGETDVRTSNWTIENCIIIYSNSYDPINRFYNPIIRNNYIKPSYSSAGSASVAYITGGMMINNICFNTNFLDSGGPYKMTDCVITNNVFHAASVKEAYPNNVFIDTNKEETVFVLKGTNDQRYQLKADSPAKGAATDGGDCGPFGGLYPYVIGGKPAGYPYYTKAVIGTRAENGKINVSLNIKMQNE